MYNLSVTNQTEFSRQFDGTIHAMIQFEPPHSVAVEDCVPRSDAIMEILF